MDALARAAELAEFGIAIQAEAESDAHAVAAFLHDKGLISPARCAGEPIPFSLEYVIGLGLGLRFQRWEHANISAHIDVGLPTATEVFRQVETLKSGPELCQFIARVLLAFQPLFHELFLWRVDAGDPRVEMAIARGDQKQLLDAVADYLWQQIQCNNGHEGQSK